MADEPTNKPDEKAVDEVAAEVAEENVEGSLSKDAEGSLLEDAEGSLLEEAEGSLLEEAEGSEDDLPAALETALAEAEALKDAALRAQAEVENIRRRAARDVENAHKFALERFTANLLPVLDSLEKAVESATSAEDASAVGQGVDLSLKLFLTTLANSGVEQIDPHGEPFNPEHHEAIAMVENPDAEPNSVMEVIQKGYVLNGRLVRAAKVIVVKAPVDGPEDGPETGAEEALKSGD
jgi:molecular chaperone GrpE